MKMSSAIYQLKPNLDDDHRFDGLTFWRDGVSPVFAEEYNVFDVENPMSVNWTPKQTKNDWRPLPVISTGVNPFHDYPCINLSIPAYSNRAVNALGKILTDNGKLLALDTDIGNYYGYVCMTKLVALDLEKSIVRRGNPNERAFGISYYEFKPEMLVNATIFRIPEQPGVYFVTDVFKERVEQSKLNGFHFIPVWPLPETSNWEMEETLRRRASAKATIVGEAIVLRFQLETHQPSEIERRRAADFEATLRRMLKFTSLQEPYLGSIESVEFENGEFRVFCTCPNCEELESHLKPMLLELDWPNGIICVKRYGNLFYGRPKERSVEYRKPSRPVEPKRWLKAKVECSLQKRSKKPSKNTNNHSEGDLLDKMPEQIRESAQQALSMLNLKENDTTKTIVSAIDQFVYNWQSGIRPPIPCEAEDLPYTLGSLWGEQLVREFGWEWRMIIFHDHGDKQAPAVVSPDRSFVIYPIHFIIGCMQDASVDATILLSFNMMREPLNSTGPIEQKYANLMEQIFRIVPRIATQQGETPMP